jgi:hypothetical protein
MPAETPAPSAQHPGLAEDHRSVQTLVSRRQRAAHQLRLRIRRAFKSSLWDRASLSHCSKETPRHIAFHQSRAQPREVRLVQTPLVEADVQEPAEQQVAVQLLAERPIRPDRVQRDQQLRLQRPIRVGLDGSKGVLRRHSHPALRMDQGVSDLAMADPR